MNAEWERNKHEIGYGESGGRPMSRVEAEALPDWREIEEESVRPIPRREFKVWKPL